MDNEKIEGRVRNLAEHIAPDCLDEILSSCGDAQKGNVIIMSEVKNKKRFAPLLVAAALLLVCLGGFMGYNGWQNQNTVSSVVMLDVNPSISISVNAKEKVLAVTALNDDGKKVVGDMDFSGSTLDVTVNALIGSMLQNGYLDDVKNSILVSVENGDELEAKNIQDKVTAAINSVFSGASFEPAVLSQTVAKNDDQRKALAEQYGISEGKAELITKLVAKDPTLSFETLAALSMNDINLIASSRKIDDSSVKHSGSASSSDYIGEAAAKEIAFTHAGVLESDVTILEIDFDYDWGVMMYEIEFWVGNAEYEYDVNARTGEVVKYERDSKDGDGNKKDSDDDNDYDYGQDDDGQSQGTSPQATDFIGETSAKSAALSHAGVTEGDISSYRIELDYDDGRYVYEIEFNIGSMEYDYDIDAMTGTVLKYEHELDD